MIRHFKEEGDASVGFFERKETKMAAKKKEQKISVAEREAILENNGWKRNGKLWKLQTEKRSFSLEMAWSKFMSKTAESLRNNTRTYLVVVDLRATYDRNADDEDAAHTINRLITGMSRQGITGKVSLVDMNAEDLSDLNFVDTNTYDDEEDYDD